MAKMGFIDNLVNQYLDRRHPLPDPPIFRKPKPATTKAAAPPPDITHLAGQPFKKNNGEGEFWTKAVKGDIDGRTSKLTSFDYSQIDESRTNGRYCLEPEKYAVVKYQYARGLSNRAIAAELKHLAGYGQTVVDHYVSAMNRALITEKAASIEAI